MKRARRTALSRIRKALVKEYHKLSDVMVEDYPKVMRPGDPDPHPELSTAFGQVSDAINCLNRELGYPENR